MRQLLREGSRCVELDAVARERFLEQYERGRFGPAGRDGPDGAQLEAALKRLVDNVATATECTADVMYAALTPREREGERERERESGSLTNVG